MALAVSVLAGLGVEAVVGGAGGADATELSALALGAEAVELGAGSLFNGAGVLIAAELWVDDFGLAAGEVERGAEATVERLELVLAEVFGEAVATLAGSFALGATSATLGLSFVSVVVAATSAGAVALGSALPGVTLAVAAGCGTAISLSLRLWLTSIAPPSTEATMTPNAIPK